MSEAECHTADWYQSGFSDGKGGKDEQIDKHYSACSEYKVNVDQKQYRKGYQDGLREYCTPQGGWSRGASGWGYSSFCAKDLEPLFIKAYAAGKEYSKTQKLIHNLEEEKARLEEKVVSNDSKLTKENKLGYMRKIGDIEEKIDSLIDKASQQNQNARNQGWLY